MSATQQDLLSLIQEAIVILDGFPVPSPWAARAREVVKNVEDEGLSAAIEKRFTQGR